MAKAHIHAESSVRRWGGTVADYMPIHLFLDSSKQAVADNRHRAFTHNSWFIAAVLPRVFGDTIVNSDGKTVSVADIGERHVIEDYGMKFIPTPQDFIQAMRMESWMNNGRGDPPPSQRPVEPDQAEFETYD